MLQRLFLANRCYQGLSSLPSPPLRWQQHRRISTAVSVRNIISVSATSYPFVFGEASSYENELLVVERRRDELESLLEVYNRESFLESGYTKRGIRYEKKWLDTLEELIQFYYKEGRLPKWNAGEKGRLATWMNTQRRAKRRVDEGNPNSSLMNPERISILESMSWWSWDAQEAAWQSGFEELAEEVKITGKIPPQSHPTLGNWVHTQRKAYKAWKARVHGETEKYKGVNHYMDQARARKLELVPGWKWC
ncbi:hypothetical protein Ndes2526A_g00393 [Nannochloris sp. 'desiccata']